MGVLAERVAELARRGTLILPQDFDRRGMYDPEAGPTPPRSGDAAAHTPGTGAESAGPKPWKSGS